MTTSRGQEQDGTGGPPLGRVAAVLQFMAGVGRPTGPREVARVLGMSKSTAQRVLAGMGHFGLVRRLAEGYVLDSRWLAAGGGPEAAGLRLRQVSVPYLVELYQAVRCPAQLALLRGSRVWYAHSIRGVGSPVPLGARNPSAPAFATAAGRVLLAGSPLASGPGHAADRVLEQVRRQGFSLVPEDRERDLWECAVPVHERGAVVAALSAVTEDVRQAGTLVAALRRTSWALVAESGSPRVADGAQAG
ncbi:helix-turn-helix domain-containing protein [Kitasatospora sp. NPDC088134]|uniref:helix-turn-helix domain-containing protein n=1 Tax=Kitasatospora sp. NPDC088134 TaxID=3364071 RepID=UPI00381AB4F3